MVDWKREEEVGEKHGITFMNILELTRQKYIVKTFGKNA